MSNLSLAKKSLTSSVESQFTLLLKLIETEVSLEEKINTLYFLSNLYSIIEESSKKLYELLLVNLIIKDDNENVRYHSAKILSNLPTIFDNTENLLIDTLGFENDPIIKMNCVWVLGKRKIERAVDAIHHLIQKSVELNLLRVSATALGRIKDRKSIPVLVKLFHIGDKLITRRVLWALGEIGSLDVVDEIVNFVDGDDYRIYDEAFQSLLKICRSPLSANVSPEMIESVNYIQNNITSLVKSKPHGAYRFMVDQFAILPNGILLVSFTDGHLLAYAMFAINASEEEPPVRLILEKA